MTDETIKVLLEQYVDAEMDLLDPAQLPEHNHHFSSRYKKKIKKLFWCEKYFGTHIRTGYAVRRAAVILLAFLSLAAAGEVSARVFGFQPWQYITQYLSENKMEQKNFTTPVSPDEGQNTPTAVRELPNYIPEGMKKYSEPDVTKKSCYADWCNSDETQWLQYVRMQIGDTTVVASDAEYTKKRKCSVAGYVAYFYEKGNENWLMWEDTKYTYYIASVSLPDSEKELKKVANSLYKKN